MTADEELRDLALKLAREHRILTDHGVGRLYEIDLEAIVRAAVAHGLRMGAEVCHNYAAGYQFKPIPGPCLTEFPHEGGGRHDGMTYAAALRVKADEMERGQ